MASQDLTTVASVREFLQKPAGDTDQDAVIQSLITHASTLIMSDTEREFAPTSAGVTRTFEVEAWPEGMFSLAPYDLRTLTTIQVDTDLTARTLTSDEFRLFPQPASDGVYSHVRVATLSFPVGTILWRTRQIKVTGDWGFPSVPDDVKHACNVTVAIWLRRDVAAFSTTFNIDEQSVERPEALPSAVRGMLSGWKRVPVG